MLGESFDELADGPNLVRVQTRRGLIQNNEVWVVYQGIREPNSLTIAFGEFLNFFAQ